MNKTLSSPIGIIGVFKPIYLETGNTDERDGKYCKVIEASFWTDSQGDYGELVIEFLDGLERLTVGVDELVVV